MFLYKFFSIIDPGQLTSLPKGSPDAVLATAFKIVFALAGAISVLIIIFAGLRMITTSGNPESANKARNAVVYAAIGLIFCIAAFSVVSFVLTRL